MTDLEKRVLDLEEKLKELDDNALTVANLTWEQVKAVKARLTDLEDRVTEAGG